ncbi:TatD family hydrolase [Planctomicrobium piriforme]|uniref:TatD DNase family protein n=1 Tax=Planctomicrobium piriforme TaxID=1576369 RepID=A0A1I3G1W6_9PLAN|nr:TatD family hydrolase [Planctomicrobium piriforme]SFI17272.1 TatD DNase family protein [Planctomicrobium piriforme]
MLIDTHAHLDEQSFETDLEAVLQRAREQGIEMIFTIGVTAPSCQAALLLAKTHPQLRAVVGIQPNYVAQAQADDFDFIAALASDPHVVAVGETGLDRYWDTSPFALQQEFFHRHIELSRRVDKPFIVHCREADADVVAVLREEAKIAPLRGVMHSFCGDQATADACLELGMYLSFAGMLTFKSNQALRDVAKTVPVDHLLVETDSPYLSPVPLRGKRNEPANVIHTARCLAELRGLSLEELAQHTTANTRRLFQLD